MRNGLPVPVRPPSIEVGFTHLARVKPQELADVGKTEEVGDLIGAKPLFIMLHLPLHAPSLSTVLAPGGQVAALEGVFQHSRGQAEIRIPALVPRRFRGGWWVRWLKEDNLGVPVVNGQFASLRKFKLT